MIWAIIRALRWFFAGLGIAGAAALFTGTAPESSRAVISGLQTAASAQYCDARSLDPKLCRCIAAEVAKTSPLKLMVMQSRGYDDPDKRAFADRLGRACS